MLFYIADYITHYKSFPGSNRGKVMIIYVYASRMLQTIHVQATQDGPSYTTLSKYFWGIFYIAESRQMTGNDGKERWGMTCNKGPWLDVTWGCCS